jgi:hypothetical protein
MTIAMTFTEFMYATGRVFLKIFEWMRGIGGIPNVLIIICIFLAVCIWVWMMARYNREAEQNGTLK